MATIDLRQTLICNLHILWIQLESNETATESFGYDGRGSGAHEGIQEYSRMEAVFALAAPYVLRALGVGAVSS